MNVNMLSEATHPEEGHPKALRIGEAARACGVTTRTLRYWQEFGLLRPSGQPRGRSDAGSGGERHYLPADLERALRIKELQDLLGFSLSEIKAVLDTDDVIDELRAAYRASARPEVQLRLVSDAVEANSRLLARLDDTLQRVQAFREERAQKAKRLRAYARELRAQVVPRPEVGE